MQHTNLWCNIQIYNKLKYIFAKYNFVNWYYIYNFRVIINNNNYKKKYKFFKKNISLHYISLSLKNKKMNIMLDSK